MGSKKSGRSTIPMRFLDPKTGKVIGDADSLAIYNKIIRKNAQGTPDPADSQRQRMTEPPNVQPQQDEILPKYYLTNDVISVDGRKLHRIVAARDIPEINVQEGDLGGYIESERNLSHRGTCWVFEGKVYENASVTGGATVRGEKVRIHNNASITDGFVAYDSAHLYGNFRGSGCAKICDYASAGGKTIQKGSSYIGGSANIKDCIVSGDAMVRGQTVAIQGTEFRGGTTYGGTFVGGTVGPLDTSHNEQSHEPMK